MARKNPNPMVQCYGFGPAHRKCGDCAHLIHKRRARVYYKCRFRKKTNGPGTDHRVRWVACGKFEKADG